jgi:precorrin-8X/cobalt-precorrin-8 methylmutase
MSRRGVHPIEVMSYRILRSTMDTSHLPRYTRQVVERIVHTTADVSWRDELVTDESALDAGAEALRTGAPLVVDVRMVAAGISAYPSICLVGRQREPDGLTRAAAGIRRAARRAAEGAVWAIGTAPTALAELLRLCAAGTVRPALVIGLPVGFVGAAEAKAALCASTLPCLSNRGSRGGAAIAAAAVNALLYGDPLVGGEDG